jgi:hypothetical protein
MTIRVIADWDNDNYFNTNVIGNTPQNYIKSAPFYGGLNPADVGTAVWNLPTKVGNSWVYTTDAPVGIGVYSLNAPNANKKVLGFSFRDYAVMQSVDITTDLLLSSKGALNLNVFYSLRNTNNYILNSACALRINNPANLGGYSLYIKGKTLSGVTTANNNSGSGNINIDNGGLIPVGSNPSTNFPVTDITTTGDFRIDDIVVIGQEEVNTNDFYFNNKLANTYFSFYIKSTVSTSIPFSIVGQTATTNHTINITTLNDWQRIEVLVTQANGRFYIEFPATVGNISLCGFMSTDIANAPYSAGYAGYDDISSYVRSIEFEYGKKDFEDALPFEGTATIELNNNTKLFSPENVSSPLVDYLKTDIKILIQQSINDSNTQWKTLFTGFISDYKIGLSNANPYVTISLAQGLQRLRNDLLPTKLYKDTNLSLPLNEVLDNSGWITATQWRNNRLDKMLLDNTAYLVTSIASLIEPSTNKYEYIGSQWSSEDTNIADALESILTTENMQMYIDGSNNIKILNRYSFFNRTPSYTLNIDTQVQNVDYIYSSKVLNKVEVNVTPIDKEPLSTVWKSNEPLAVGRKSTLDTIIRIRNEAKNSYRLDTLGTVTLSIYKYNRKRGGTLPELISNAKVTGTIESTGYNRYRLLITNEDDVDYYVDASITATSYYKGGNGVTYIYHKNTDEINNIYTKSIVLDNPITEPQAKAYADYQFNRYANLRGYFNTLTLKSNTIYDVLDVIDLISTNIPTNNYYMIIGLKCTILNGDITTVYTLTWIDKTEYFKLGNTLQEAKNKWDGVPRGLPSTLTVTKNIVNKRQDLLPVKAITGDLPEYNEVRITNLSGGISHYTDINTFDATLNTINYNIEDTASVVYKSSPPFALINNPTLPVNHVHAIFLGASVINGVWQPTLSLPAYACISIIASSLDLGVFYSNSAFFIPPRAFTKQGSVTGFNHLSDTHIVTDSVNREWKTNITINRLNNTTPILASIPLLLNRPTDHPNTIQFMLHQITVGSYGKYALGEYQTSHSGILYEDGTFNSYTRNITSNAHPIKQKLSSGMNYPTLGFFNSAPTSAEDFNTNPNIPRIL